MKFPKALKGIVIFYLLCIGPLIAQEPILILKKELNNFPTDIKYIPYMNSIAVSDGTGVQIWGAKNMLFRNIFEPIIKERAFDFKIKDIMCLDDQKTIVMVIREENTTYGTVWHLIKQDLDSLTNKAYYKSINDFLQKHKSYSLQRKTVINDNEIKAFKFSTSFIYTSVIEKNNRLNFFKNGLLVFDLMMPEICDYTDISSDGKYIIAGNLKTGYLVYINTSTKKITQVSVIPINAPFLFDHDKFDANILSNNNVLVVLDSVNRLREINLKTGRVEFQNFKNMGEMIVTSYTPNYKENNASAIVWHSDVYRCYLMNIDINSRQGTIHENTQAVRITSPYINNHQLNMTVNDLCISSVNMNNLGYSTPYVEDIWRINSEVTTKLLTYNNQHYKLIEQLDGKDHSWLIKYTSENNILIPKDTLKISYVPYHRDSTVTVLTHPDSNFVISVTGDIRTSDFFNKKYHFYQNNHLVHEQKFTNPYSTNLMNKNIIDQFSYDKKYMYIADLCKRDLYNDSIEISIYQLYPFKLQHKFRYMVPLYSITEVIESCGFTSDNNVFFYNSMEINNGKANYYLKNLDVNTGIITTSAQLMEDYIPVKTRMYKNNYHLISMKFINEGFVQTMQIYDRKFNMLNNFDLTGLPSIKDILIEDSMMYMNHGDFIRIFKIRENKLLFLANIIPSLNSSFSEVDVTFNRFNYYYTKSDASNVSYLYNKKLYPSDLFNELYNRPDTIMNIIDYAGDETVNIYHEAYLRKIKKMGSINKVALQELPAIKIISSYQSNGTVFVTIAYKKEDNIKEIKFKTNGVSSKASVEVFSVKKPIKNYPEYKNGFTETIKFASKLVDHKNSYSITLIDENGKESLPESFVVYKENYKPTGELYLLNIGVSNYMDSTYNLSYADNDAISLQNIFKEKYKNDSVKKIHSVLLTNEKFTLTEFINQMNTLKEQCKTDDELIISYSGHGLIDNNSGNLFLATYHMDFNDPTSKGLAYDTIQYYLGQITSQKKLLLLDACHAGEFDKETIIGQVSDNSKTTTREKNKKGAEIFQDSTRSKTNTFELMQELFAEIYAGNGAYVISATAGDRVAFENKEYQNGLFTYAIIKALNSPSTDIDGSGTISIAELYKYVKAYVPQISNGLQNPKIRQWNYYINWEIWR